MSFTVTLTNHRPYRARHRRPRRIGDAAAVIGLGVLLWAAVAIGAGVMSR